MYTESDPCSREQIGCCDAMQPYTSCAKSRKVPLTLTVKEDGQNKFNILFENVNKVLWKIKMCCLSCIKRSDDGPSKGRVNKALLAW